jgi:drug/metabolite transporter (DMT)-like permease
MGMRGSVPRSPHLLLALVVVVWAGSYAAIKALIDDGLAAPDVALGRYLVAAPGFAVALVLSRGLPGLGRRDLGRLVLAGLLVVAVYHLSLNAGERLTTAGTASVVVAAAPGIALAMAVAIGQERFSRRRAAGLAISFAGVVVVVLLGSGQRISFANVHGPLLVVAAPVAFAAYNVIAKPLLPRYGVLPVTAAASLIGTAALLPFASGATIRRVSGLGAGGVALLLYLGLAATLAGYIGWSRGLRRLEASRTVAYLYVVPVVAIVIGALTLGEHVTVWLGLGAVLVVAGVALAQ